MWPTTDINQVLQYRLTEAIAFCIHSVKTLKKMEHAYDADSL